MHKTGKMILLVLLAVSLAGGGIFVGIHWNNWFGKENTPASVSADIDDSAEDWEGEQAVYTGKKNKGTIDIPGFDVMNLKAESKEQTVNLYNPEQNTCYFRISLFLASGEKLWASDLIEPGKGLHSIQLEQTLSAGQYEAAILKYECFTMDGSKSPLNGSEIKLTLNVLE